jgi:hypothetical protein
VLAKRTLIFSFVEGLFFPTLPQGRREKHAKSVVAYDYYYKAAGRRTLASWHKAAACSVKKREDLEPKVEAALSHFGGHYLARATGGWRQRVALAKQTLKRLELTEEHYTYVSLPRLVCSAP